MHNITGWIYTVISSVFYTVNSSIFSTFLCASTIKQLMFLITLSCVLSSARICYCVLLFAGKHSKKYTELVQTHFLYVYLPSESVSGITVQVVRE